MDNKNFLSQAEILFLISKNKEFFRLKNYKIVCAFNNIFDIENDFVQFEICYIPNNKERTKHFNMTYGQFVDVYIKTFGIEL